MDSEDSFLNVFRLALLDGTDDSVKGVVEAVPIPGRPRLGERTDGRLFQLQGGLATSVLLTLPNV